MTILFNTKENKDLRRTLRKQDITCEKIMWSKLRNRAMGYKFRRQHGIGNFIVDFFCPKLELVVEIDGATHGTDEEMKNDLSRQNFLEKQGFIIKRYSNTDVKENLEAVLTDLQDVCETIEAGVLKTDFTPTLSLRRRGGKE